MKSEWSGSSAALTSARPSVPSRDSPAFTAALSAATKTKACPARSGGRYVRATWRIAPARAHAWSRAVSVGLTTVTRAPASRSPSTLRSATAPPPTTRQGRVPMSTKIG